MSHKKLRPCIEVFSNPDACSIVEERRFSAVSQIAFRNCHPDRSFAFPKGMRSGVEGPAVRPHASRSLAATFAAIALIVLAASPFSARAQKPSGANLTADLPAGTMQAKATTSCLECHEARIILQQRLSKGAWTKEVDKMTKWGALVDPADRDALIDYLSTNFSPDKPPYDPQRTSGGSGSKK
jgi:mono/diheme cytochrome c family protein